MRSFTAVVTGCEAAENGYAVTLSRTAFFPEGGGQGADRGTINGVAVTDVQETGVEVAHFMPEPAEVGTEVLGELDWPTRFRRMQCHSGEHIVSGTVHRLFGYDNVGFHMGESTMTLDFSGELSAADLERVEDEANLAVWNDLEVKTSYPSPEELAALEYRSKKELDGDVRIVSIEGVDTCACCAPHAARTGEIGAIKITDSMRHRGGMRLTVVCGADALRDYRMRWESTVRISQLLSAKQHETAQAVERVAGELEAARRRLDSASRELLEIKKERLRPTDGNICLFEPDMDTVSLRGLVNAGAALCGGVCAAFRGEDGDYKYIIGSPNVDLRAGAKRINAAILGRGGGSPEMIQGTSAADRKTIEAFFAGTRL